MSDREILEAQALTGSLAGIFAEPAAATSVGAAKKLRDRVGTDDTVVCNLTGNGLKQPEVIEISEKQLTPIVPTLDVLRERVGR